MGDGAGTGDGTGRGRGREPGVGWLGDTPGDPGSRN